MIDIGIGICLLGSAALGFKDGFFRKLYGILGLLGGICAALLLYGWAGELFGRWFELEKEVARLVAFSAIFIIFFILMNIIYRSIGDESDKAIPVWSRLFGGGIGAFEGALIASLILMLATKFGLIDDLMIKESEFYKSFIDFTPKVMTATMKWLPKAQEFIQELKGKL